MKEGTEGREGRQRGSTDGRPRGRWREGQKDRNTGVGSRDPGVLTSRGECKSQEGALPRPISSGSREKKDLRSPREGRRGGLIRALAAAAPFAPPKGAPHLSPGHLKGSSAH